VHKYSRSCVCIDTNLNRKDYISLCEEASNIIEYQIDGVKEFIIDFET
jgi:hypothetical protein